MSFGNILKKLRQENNLTQDELAKKVNTSRSNIANYENDKNMPSVDILEKLSHTLNCSVDYLMGKTSKNIVTNDMNSIKNYYEEKINVTLENKYSNEFRSLKLTGFEIESLIKSMDFKDKLSREDRHVLLNSTLSIIAINHNETVLDKIKSLIEEYTQEKLDLLNAELKTFKEIFEQEKKILIDEHVDKLHPAISGKASASLDENVNALLGFLNKNNLENFHMCPVYGQISAGQPNWAEECLEGYLPIDPNLMNIINPEEHFFLRVNGDSMNKVVKDGAFALIHKQEEVENGEIAVVLVNGDEATLKKFSKQNDIVILEPISGDPTYTTQVYDKETEIKILGKYVGKFEINN